MKSFILIIILFISSISLRAQWLTDDIKDILSMQDMRTLGENRKLLNYLKSDDTKIVCSTLMALANITDSSTVDRIGDILLNHAGEKERFYAAFALGQIGNDKCTQYLLKALKKEGSDISLESILDNLGKIGDVHSFDELIAYASVKGANSPGFVLAVARYAIRGIKNDKAVALLLENLNSGATQKDLELYTAYAFFRMRNRQLLLPAKERILSMTVSENAESRMWAFGALGYAGDNKDYEYALNQLFKEKDWRVKVNILNSLPVFQKNNNAELNNLLCEAISAMANDENINVRITALRTAGILFSDSAADNPAQETIKQFLESYFPPDKAIDYPEKGEAIISYGKIFKDASKEIILSKYSETENYDLKPFIVRAFGYFNDGMIYKELTDSIRADVVRYNEKNGVISGEMIQNKIWAGIYFAYVETLGALKKKVNKENQNIIRLILGEFTGSKDPQIVDACLNSLNDSIFINTRNETGLVLTYDFSDLNYPKDKEVMILIINEFGELRTKEAIPLLEKTLKVPNYDVAKTAAKALKSITGKDFKVIAKPKTDFDWNYLNKIQKRLFVNIKTELGTIKIKLDLSDAPFSVMNFVKLSEKGFYNGTDFHRVVPNFVIQGGDPMNTGWGGPDYSIRSEFSPVHYTTGVFGMASDGKDTESSQFFIMHSPHFHLDGRYTVFGYVVNGQDVVDKIWLGDKVENITFSEN